MLPGVDGPSGDLPGLARRSRSLRGTAWCYPAWSVSPGRGLSWPGVAGLSEDRPGAAQRFRSPRGPGFRGLAWPVFLVPGLTFPCLARLSRAWSGVARRGCALLVPSRPYPAWPGSLGSKSALPGSPRPESMCPVVAVFSGSEAGVAVLSGVRFGVVGQQKSRKARSHLPRQQGPRRAGQAGPDQPGLRKSRPRRVTPTRAFEGLGMLTWIPESIATPGHCTRLQRARPRWDTPNRAPKTAAASVQIETAFENTAAPVHANSGPEETGHNGLHQPGPANFCEESAATLCHANPGPLRIRPH